jgi:hypothetical protein
LVVVRVVTIHPANNLVHHLAGQVVAVQTDLVAPPEHLGKVIAAVAAVPTMMTHILAVAVAALLVLVATVQIMAVITISEAPEALD